VKSKQEIVRDWLPRYTGRPIDGFGRYVLLTNFLQYVELFADRFGVEVVGRDRRSSTSAWGAPWPPR
jgi:AMP nucleosidase